MKERTRESVTPANLDFNICGEELGHRKLEKESKKNCKTIEKTQIKIHCTDHDLYCTEKSKQENSKKNI